MRPAGPALPRSQLRHVVATQVGGRVHRLPARWTHPEQFQAPIHGVDDEVARVPSAGRKHPEALAVGQLEVGADVRVERSHAPLERDGTLRAWVKATIAGLDL